MSHKPEERKAQEMKAKLIEENGGPIFDFGLEEPEIDPIYDMRKYIIHFRLMVLSDKFTHIHPGSILTFGQPDRVITNRGVVTEDALIWIPDIDETVKSLTAYATAVTPDDWLKTEKSGRVTKSRPDGWARVWLTLDNGGAMAVEDVLFKHHADLGYTVDELSNIEFITNELIKMGHGDKIKDLESELKTWKTKQKKSQSAKQALNKP